VNKKQNTLTFMDSLVLSSIVVKPASSKLVYTPAIDGEIKATTLTIEDPFTEESINVKDTLNSKQDIINDGDLTFAKTAGLVAAINSTAKLASFNNFTANQTITGDLLVTGGAIANTATVLSTTPTLDGHLTSKLYVDNELNKKQNTLLAGTNITISGNTISSTGSTITQADLDTKQNTLLAGTNITISGNTISSTGGITQAQLDTKQNTLTSSTNILTKRIDVSDKIVITGTQPTLYLKDTNNRSGMIHMNSDKMYFLSGGTNTESWTPVNGRWPLVLHTNSGFAEFGANIYSPGTVDGTVLKVSMANNLY
jgi:hypothetical protein